MCNILGGIMVNVFHCEGPIPPSINVEGEPRLCKKYGMWCVSQPPVHPSFARADDAKHGLKSAISAL